MMSESHESHEKVKPQEARETITRQESDGTITRRDPHQTIKRKVQVVVFTHSPETRVLLLRRPPDRDSIWQPVTGNVDAADTSLLEAARRELAEETGITDLREIRDTGHDFRFTKGGRPIVERLIGAETAAITAVVLSHEHVAADWVGLDEAIDRLQWETNREGVRRVVGRAGFGTRTPRPRRDD